ncbi:MAG TPA: tripartite tricarboxylate transporter substrate binding protein [Burkholderiales bacterium]|nr:tripartite tricarboxylate transporter substrate binding protein [Burkholderiales bacterium]
MQSKAIVLAAVAVTALAASASYAQSYPTRPIRLVVPFGPGGGSDFVGRLAGQKLSEQMGQQVVVDNRAGAASLVGTEIVLRSPPDGYTLLLGDSGFGINLAYYKNATYNAVKDFAPVTVVADTPYILAVNPSLPYAGSLKDLIAAAKAQPGKLAVGSSGAGSGTHFTGELFRLRAGVNMIHVPYKGGGAVLADVAAGHIASTMTTPPAAFPLVKAGRLKILAAASAKRSPLLPDVPTFAEQGVPDVLVSNWYGIIGVGGTPQPVIKKLHDELLKAIASPDMRERLTASGLEPHPITPEQFSKMIVSEVERWKRVAKESGIRQE